MPCAGISSGRRHRESRRRGLLSQDLCPRHREPPRLRPGAHGPALCGVDRVGASSRISSPPAERNARACAAGEASAGRAPADARRARPDPGAGRPHRGCLRHPGGGPRRSHPGDRRAAPRRATERSPANPPRGAGARMGIRLRASHGGSGPDLAGPERPQPSPDPDGGERSGARQRARCRGRAGSHALPALLPPPRRGGARAPDDAPGADDRRPEGRRSSTTCPPSPARSSWACS